MRITQTFPKWSLKLKKNLEDFQIQITTLYIQLKIKKFENYFFGKDEKIPL